MTELTHVHISGKFNATGIQLHAALDEWMAGADVADLTEVGFLDAPLRFWALSNRYRLLHSAQRGKSEVAILVKREGWRVEGHQYHKLTGLHLHTARKAPLYALSGTVRSLENWATATLTGTHLPAHVEGGEQLKQGWASRVYRAAALGWAHAQSGHKGNRIVSADWNLNLRRPWVRGYLRSAFPRLRPGFDVKRLPHNGTHGPRIIDGPRSNMPIVKHSEILRAMPGFDHRPVRTVYEVN